MNIREQQTVLVTFSFGMCIHEIQIWIPEHGALRAHTIMNLRNYNRVEKSRIICGTVTCSLHIPTILHVHVLFTNP